MCAAASGWGGWRREARPPANFPNVEGAFEVFLSECPGTVPFEYKIDATHSLITVTAEGPIDFHQSLALGEALTQDPAFDRRFAVLVDLRRMDFEPHLDEIRDFAETLPRLRDAYRSRVAVVTQPGFIHRLVRYTTVLAEDAGFPMEAFSSREEALNWLDELEP